MAYRDGQDEAGKIFVGGIARDIDEGILTSYFSQFGNVCLATVMRDKFGISRGFGFVAFDPPEVARDVLRKVHTIEGRTIEIKQAVKHDRVMGSGAGGPRGGGPVATTVDKDGSIFVARQVYVGGLPYHITEKEVREYFEQFGAVVSANLKYDFSQNPPKFRGFGFVNFVDDDSVEKALENYSSHQLSGKWIEVKRSKHSHVVQGENSGVIMSQMAQGTGAGKGGAYDGGRASAVQDPYGGVAIRDPYGGVASRDPYGGQSGGPMRPQPARSFQSGGSYRASPYGGAPPSSHPREAVPSYREISNRYDGPAPHRETQDRYDSYSRRDRDDYHRSEPRRPHMDPYSSGPSSAYPPQYPPREGAGDRGYSHQTRRDPVSDDPRHQYAPNYSGSADPRGPPHPPKSGGWRSQQPIQSPP